MPSNGEQLEKKPLASKMRRCPSILFITRLTYSLINSYEDEISYATQKFSDHPFLPITELEVFTGTLFNKSGGQTRRQRDRSIQLKDEFDRITKSTEVLSR